MKLRIDVQCCRIHSSGAKKKTTAITALNRRKAKKNTSSCSRMWNNVNSIIHGETKRAKYDVSLIPLREKTF